MKVYAIILFAFVYIGAVVTSLIDTPRTYTLFGVKYGEKLKEMNDEGKRLALIVRGLRFIFYPLHLLGPIVTLFYMWTPIEHPFAFFVVYVVATALWLAVARIFTDSTGQKRYKSQIDEILKNNSLYQKTVSYLAAHREIKVVLPCTDGVAFFAKSLNKTIPRNQPKAAVPEDYLSTASGLDGDDYDKALGKCCKDFSKRRRGRYVSVNSCDCDNAIFAKEHGFKTLSENDMRDICRYLAQEKALNMKNEKRNTKKQFYINVTLSGEYEHKIEKVQTAELNLRVAVRK